MEYGILIVVIILVVGLFVYFESKEFGLYIDRQYLYKDKTYCLLSYTNDEYMYCVILEYITDDIVLIKLYTNYGIEQIIIDKSKLIELKGNK